MLTRNQILELTVYPIISVMLFLVFPYYGYSLVYFIWGLFLWNLNEYLVHRFAFHNRKLPRKLKRSIGYGHTAHHRKPTEDLALSINITLPIVLLYCTITFGIFGVGGLSWTFFGIMAGMYFYEFMHYAAHYWDIQSGYFQFMKRYHLEHHNKNPNSKFGVSSPIFDYLLGTTLRR